MKQSTSDQHIREQAAIWVARLHADHVSEQVKTNFCAWLTQDTRHAAIFEQVSDSWDFIAGVARPVAVPPATLSPYMPKAQPVLRRRALLPLLVAGAGCLVLSYPRTSVAVRVLKTRTAQTLTYTQPNGVEWRLDTDTILLLNEKTMEGRLLRGQVYLNCPTQSDIKLMVGNLQATIQKTGQFDACLTDTTCELLALNGQLSVSNALSTLPAQTITKGQRIFLSKNSKYLTDQPNMQNSLSWTQGYLIFHDSSLRDMATKINRYSEKKIKILSKKIENKKVNGIYYISKNNEFLTMLSTLLKIQFDETEHEYLIYEA
ncbi:DUF4880 domain-containing protein [Acetobacter orientalis]|uniref:FecR family protein n=3 Tax=Acetobacter orientalis TaxID=146474 RepID=UPI0039EBC177